MTTSTDTDNRTHEDVHAYEEARIKALKERIWELEADNKRLAQQNRELCGLGDECMVVTV